MLIAACFVLVLAPFDRRTNLAYLRQLAHEVVDAAKVLPGAEIQGSGRNTTGFTLRVPGGTQNYYPAFWTRDASMMLGADLVHSPEIEGWIRVVAKTQAGPKGLTFPHGLIIPPFSIPDHITLAGEACWFPGAYTNQGDGHYGYLPPADDAFYFVQMVWDYARLTNRVRAMSRKVSTGWGDHQLSDVCVKAYQSVEVDPKTGLVVCSGTPGRRRVDWGFCDSITKQGLCLMPSLLRWQAACRLSELLAASGRSAEAGQFRADARLIAKSVVSTFYRPESNGNGLLVSATDVGVKDDIWASTLAVWLGLLPRKIETAVARHLLTVYTQGDTVIFGQVRQLPTTGVLGGYWDEGGPGHDSYQNGGYWATPTGWLVVALSKVDRAAADKVLNDYVVYVKENRAKGAPFEWINPKTGAASNGNYGSSAGLVYTSMREAGFYERAE